MLRVLALLFALILPQGLMAQGYRSLSGSVTYLDRMGLAPEAVLLIEVLGPDLSPLVEARIPTGGQQVPIPFALEIPDGAEGILRAGLAMGGQVVWLGGPLAIEAGGPDDLGAIILSRHTPMGFFADYRCGDAEVRVGFTGAALVMEALGARRLLHPVPAASGARYEALDDPATFFWSKSDGALVSLGGAEMPDCQLILPRHETPWRGGGNEPFWSVRIDAGAMTLSRLGMEDLILRLEDPLMSDAGDVLVIATDPDHALRTVLTRRPAICRDSMTGMPHPETIELSMGDHSLSGCGGDPARLLVGPDWLVEDIGGASVPEGADLTLGFGTDGRVAGSGGCNRWFASFDLTGEVLGIGPPGATMMACAPPVMDQERRFFDALAKATGFDIGADGALILLGSDGALITARSHSAP